MAMINRHYVQHQGKRVPSIFGSKGCFPAGTMITMADGTFKDIKDISPSDIVWSFKKYGELGPATVTEVFFHEMDNVIRVKHQYGTVDVTPNHWMMGSDGLFKEMQEFEIGEELVLQSGTPSTILNIVTLPDAPVYTFTVPETQTYIAENLRVHNKGGGKSGSQGGKEDPNNLFSTDILFVTSALGEGPMYRINPNGPQDIEVNDGNIDDMINIDGDGQENTEFFRTATNTGTVTQQPLPVFGEQTVGPQNFSSPVTLKKGNVAGVPQSRIFLQSTSANDWDQIKFAFVISALQESKDNGDIVQRAVSIRITLFDSTGSTTLRTVDKTIRGKTNSPFKFTVDITIPAASQSANGYKFTIEKTSDDSDSSKVQETIQSIGWFEIENQPQAYPRTAHIGYALKAFAEHTGGVPNFTSLVKGLLVKVPTNYNQPILTSGEIDWRELENPSSGDLSYFGNGYSLQSQGPSTKLTAPNPILYIGPWDGEFVYSWTQNPVWIMYDILTNKTYGLGVDEANIDKFKFHRVAKYCDACDDATGAFIGVEGLADGTFRHKPRDLFTSVRETLIGIPEGTKIIERRFTFNGIIQDQGQALDVLNQMAASIRAALVYSGGKITLAVDLPDETPVALFNETNIKTGSLNISGVKESEIFTGVDVSYVDPTNHFKRETVRIDTVDANDGTDRSIIENIASLDLFGVTRRSQALRYAQYQIAASRFQRRKVDFITSTDALALAPGDVISLAQRQIGVAFGYGGKIARDANTILSLGSNLMLEHLTVPTIAATDFTGNTSPLALRVIQLDADRIDLYILSNSLFAVNSTGNVSAGADLIEVRIDKRYDPITKTLVNFNQFSSNNLPKRGDLWSFGEWDNPDQFYTNKTDKLFKITSLSREPKEEEVTISAIEYVSNIYVDSDTFIDYTPTAYLDTKSPLIAPPAPVFSLRSVPTREQDGSVRVDLIVENFTESQNYGIQFETEYFISLPDESQLVPSLVSDDGSTIKFDASDITAIEDGDGPASLIGKNGFDSLTGKIRLLCNAVVSGATHGTSAVDNLRLQVEGMNVLTDYNFISSGEPKFLLDVNDGLADGIFQGLKGHDAVTVPISVQQRGGSRNFVDAGPELTGLSANIRFADRPNNFIYIDNPITNDVDLGSKLLNTPFYVEIFQILDSRYFNSRANFYVGGSEFTYTQKNTFTGVGTHTEPLPITPRNSAFVRVFLDNIQTQNFTLDRVSTPATIQVTPASDESQIRVEIDHYTVPAIEIGDNVQFETQNIFTVANTSYDPASPTFNAEMTANNIYQVELLTTPVANLTGVTLVNLAQDPVGTLGNVNTEDRTFTLDYDRGTFPGNFRLANNQIYQLNVGGEFEKTFLAKDRIIRDIPIGTTTVKARNRNLTGRFSPSVTKSVSVGEIPIQKVQNISITEGLYVEQLGGVATRAIIKFNHVVNQEVTDYEISYRTNNTDNTDLSSFSTVKVPANNVDDAGQVTHVINNIDRGVLGSTITLFVRVTPLNKNLRGITATAEKLIIGKTAKPQNITDFGAGQSEEQLTLFWQYPRQASGDLVDLDLKEVVIRRVAGIRTATEENFNAANPFLTVAAGVSRKSSPIDAFGDFTYLAKTRDTSGNFSDDIAITTLTTFRPGGKTVFKAFNTDSPSVQFAGIPNENASESVFVSVTDTNSGGLNVAATPSTAADNANASATGWSYNAGLAVSDLTAGGDATYITPIRDMGAVITGSVQADIQGTSAAKTTFNDFTDDILTGATEVQTSPKDNVLRETNFGGLGTVLGFSNTTLSFSFDTNNETLVDSTTSQNVYAIVNPGQYTGNVISIQAITKANPAVITTSGSEHGITGTKRIIIHGVSGMTEINEREVYATRVNSTTLNIFTDSGGSAGLNSSGFSTYVSGGVLDQGDRANANALAFIAGAINANEIELGETFHANGDSTGGNAFANVTTANSGVNNYKLVNLRQYQDEASTTFAGSATAITQQTFIRTSSVDPDVLFYTGAGVSNGNVNVSAFASSSINDGFLPYEVGSRQFRFYQLKFVVLNSSPNEFDFTLDKFRVSIEKTTTTFTETSTFSNATQFVDMTSANFGLTPTVSLQPINFANAAVVLTVEVTKDHVAYRVFDIGADAVAPADGAISVALTATGI